ncbi:MAG TPA: carotenoid biosynthesis protein, partial [Chthonomonadaceae bacterium]|nr:carotenoid biosynthesis protein [Chthonomonadaceae bacterium]
MDHGSAFKTRRTAFRIPFYPSRGLAPGYYRSALLWGLALLYAAARVAQAYPEKLPMVVIVGVHVLPALLFALVHGAIRYGVRGVLAFIGICIVIGNLSENLSIATGFPFGHYHFTDVMGPKILQVPILLGLAYIGIGYVSWTLAEILLRNRAGVMTTPLVAACIMVSWDLSMDPIWANFVHG